jgi:penicillin-binding protein 2
LTPTQIEAQIVQAQEKGGRPYDPVRLPVEVNLEAITRVEENKARLGPAVLVTNDLKRFYPNGRMAAHVLGYSGVVTQDDIRKSRNTQNEDAPNEPAPNADAPNELASSSSAPSSTRKSIRELKYDDVIGKIGLEKEYDAMLAGTGGAQQYEVDARGRPVKRRGLKPEVPGHTLVLTLDARLQKAAENALDKARNSGAVAVIDPRNGEVLALASRPTFNPNIFGLPKAQFQKIWLQLNRDAKHPLINRAVTSRFPPGSTFKMITAAAGLQQGTINTRTSYTCSGGLRMGRFFGCWSTHGSQNLSGAIANSCDVFFYQSALRMGHPESSGPTYLAQVARRFGLGEPTNLDLPVEAKGLIPDPAWRKRRFPNNPDMAHWFPGNTLNMSIGQGDVLATPLQMALATGAVANGGTLWQPHLLRQMRDPGGNRVLERFKPRSQNVGIEHKHINTVRAGMRAVVTRGTGRGVALPNVEVAGKTGSAEDVHNVLPHAWFVAFAPYKNPRIAVAVIVENSGHGSENSVPIAKKILEAAFPQTTKAKKP